VTTKHFDDSRFFRVIKNFVAQFGLSGDPKANEAWDHRCLADEPVKHSNMRGTLTFARGDSGTRSTQMFINLADNKMLDTMDGFGFPPVAEVMSGPAVVDSLYSGYGESSHGADLSPGRKVRAKIRFERRAKSISTGAGRTSTSSGPRA